MNEQSGIDSVNDDIDGLTAETILKPDIYRSIFSLEDESDIVLAKDQLEEKARALKKLRSPRTYSCSFCWPMNQPSLRSNSASSAANWMFTTTWGSAC